MKELNNNIKEDYCSFEVSKLFKEKGFDVTCLHFYTNPRSKMYGVDEECGAYIIKNTPKKLYTCGKHAAEKSKNVFFAPTHALAIEWIRVNFGIHLWVEIWRNYSKYSDNDYMYVSHIWVKEKVKVKDGKSLQAATEDALKYVLEELI